MVEFGRSVLWIDDGEIGDRPAPAIGSTGKLNDVDLASQQPFAQELARLVRDFRRAVVRVWSVQPAESSRFCRRRVRYRGAHRRRPPGRARLAARKPQDKGRRQGRPRAPGRLRGATSVASAHDLRLRCAKRKFMLRACRAWPLPVHKDLARRFIGVPVAQLDRAQVS